MILQLLEEIRLPVVVVVVIVGGLSVFDDDCEIITVEVKGMDQKYTWEIIGIYRVPNEDMLAIERLAARTLPTRILTKRNIVGGDLNLPQAD